MRSVLLLTLVLLAASVLFFFNGRSALAAEKAEHAALLQREERVARMDPDLPDVAAELAEVEARLQRWRDQLRETPPTRRPSFEETLAACRLPALAGGGGLRSAVRQQAQAGAEAAAALECVLDACNRSGITDVLALQLKNGGKPRSWPGCPELQVIDGELIVTGSVPALLACLEALVPAAGMPLMSVAQATLQRIEPERWGGGLAHLSTPPALLSLSISAGFLGGNSR